MLPPSTARLPTSEIHIRYVRLTMLGLPTPPEFGKWQNSVSVSLFLFLLPLSFSFFGQRQLGEARRDVSRVHHSVSKGRFHERKQDEKYTRRKTRQVLRISRISFCIALQG
jgi:hypothetical protein